MSMQRRTELELFKHSTKCLWAGTDREYRYAAPVYLLRQFLTTTKTYLDSSVDLLMPGPGDWLLLWVEKSDLLSQSLKLDRPPVRESFSQVPANLPNTISYARGSMLTPDTKWNSFADIHEKANVEISLLAEDGCRAYTDQCYVHELYRYFVIAVSGASANKLFRQPLKRQYYLLLNSNRSTKLVTRKSLVASLTNGATATANRAAATITYVNGYPRLRTSSVAIVPGDYIESLTYNDLAAPSFDISGNFVSLRLGNIPYDEIDYRLIYNYQFAGGKLHDADLVEQTPYSVDRASEFRSKIEERIPVIHVTKTGDGSYYELQDITLLHNYINGGLASDEIMVQGTTHAPSRAAEFRSHIRNHAYLYDIDSTSSQHVFATNETSYILAHCLKVNNPNNQVMTVNKMDVLVFNSEGRGRYLPREVLHFTNPTLELPQQITHNDIAVAHTYVDYLSGLLPNTSPPASLVRVIAHATTPAKTLTRDANYLDLLYMHTDVDIVAFLLADQNRPFEIDFWSASNLLGKAYPTELTGSTRSPHELTIANYIDTYGFFNTVNILCPRVLQFSVNADSPKQFPILVPYMFNPNCVAVHVFLDGLKLPDTRVQIVGPLLFARTIDKTQMGDVFTPFSTPAKYDWVMVKDVIQSGNRVVLLLAPEVDFTPIEGTEHRSLVIEIFEDTNYNTSFAGDPNLISELTGAEL